MPWDDSDDDFFDGFTDGLLFSNLGCVAIIVILIVVAILLYVF